MSYIPNTDLERKQMLDVVGIKHLDDLFTVVPQNLKVECLDLPDPMSELEVSKTLRAMAAKNKVYSSIFRGAGAYQHYIPSIVKSVTSKETFVSAYTPYQAEISQGVLQSIFEYQTMISELTGMDASNASVYDGPSAAAEAMNMTRERNRNKVLVSAAAHPMAIEAIATYFFGNEMEMELIPLKDGVTDMDALASMLNNNIAGVYLQHPNYLGLLEDAQKAGELTHSVGAKYVMSVNPIATSLMKTPREFGADVAVGDGQALGMPLSFGGPYVGFMACTNAMLRKLPGRIVGETVDAEGNRAFVLTLQAREQHIRREKASSNICSNHALMAMVASVYMSAMGPHGMAEAAQLCYSKAHYAASEISKIPGFELQHKGDFFHEFVTKVPCDPKKVLDLLDKKDILGGLPVENGILWAVTEMNSKDQIDTLVNVLKEVSRSCN